MAVVPQLYNPLKVSSMRNFRPRHPLHRRRRSPGSVVSPGVVSAAVVMPSPVGSAAVETPSVPESASSSKSKSKSKSK